MGYRSDVALVLSGNGVKFLKHRLGEDNDLCVTITNFLNHADAHYADNTSGAEVWFWKWMKWYARDTNVYDEPCFIEDTLQLLDEKDFRFIRLGEEDDDFQNIGTYFDNPFRVDLVRYIQIEAPAEKSESVASD